MTVERHEHQDTSENKWPFTAGIVALVTAVLYRERTKTRSSSDVDLENDALIPAIVFIVSYLPHCRLMGRWLLDWYCYCNPGTWVGRNILEPAK